MKKIFKYPIFIKDQQKIEVRSKCDILTIDVQNGIIMLWAMVDIDEPSENILIEVIGTGNPVNELKSNQQRKYIKTVQLDGFVWHIFQMIES